MDRIDAMTAFVATADASGFSAAARKLGRSPAAITRAIAFLEDRTGVLLLQRTTRTLKLTEAGARYLAACRRILFELAEADALDASERATPRGLLTVTAPVLLGKLHVRPLVDAVLAANAEVQARLLLLDRITNIVEEGIDVAIRIAHLPDSSLLAVKVGEVHRLLCASPAYLTKRSRPKRPTELVEHDCISFAQAAPADHWTFAARGRSSRVKIRPRLMVNSAEASIGSALDGRGITSVLSYQVDRELREGRLVRLLAPFELPSLPVHVVYPAASALSAKVRAFVDLAVPGLRGALSKLSPRSTRGAF